FTTSLASAGVHSASAQLNSNTFYDAVNAASSITVLTPTSLSFFDFSGTITSGTRKDYIVCMAPAAAGKLVTLYLDGFQVGSALTSADGCAYMDELRLSGTGSGHTLMARFLGDSTHGASQVSATATFI